MFLSFRIELMEFHHLISNFKKYSNPFRSFSVQYFIAVMGGFLKLKYLTIFMFSCSAHACHELQLYFFQTRIWRVVFSWPLAIIVLVSYFPISYRCCWMFLLLRMSRVWITTEPNATMNRHHKDERVENIKAVLLNWTWDTYSADVYVAAPTFLFRHFLLLFPSAGVPFAAFTQRRWCSTTGRLVHISLVFRIGFQLMGCAIRKQSIRRAASYKRKSPADKSTRRVSFWPHFIQHAAFFQVHIMRFLANCTALRCVYINYSSFFK
jgi:hypothetical protein